MFDVLKMSDTAEQKKKKKCIAFSRKCCRPVFGLPSLVIPVSTISVEQIRAKWLIIFPGRIHQVAVNFSQFERKLTNQVKGVGELIPNIDEWIWVKFTQL